MREELQGKIKENKVNLMKNEFVEVIQYHMENRMLINIDRECIPGTTSLTGFPIAFTEEWLLMTNIYDFRDEGYVLIRICDITDAYSKESDSFYEMICIREKLQDKIDDCPVNEISDIGSLLAEINPCRFVSIHCEKETKKCNYFLGKSKMTTDEFVEFASINVDGQWNEVTDIIKISDITMIAFDDNYSKMYYKYT